MASTIGRHWAIGGDMTDTSRHAAMALSAGGHIIADMMASPRVALALAEACADLWRQGLARPAHGGPAQPN